MLRLSSLRLSSPRLSSPRRSLSRLSLSLALLLAFRVAAIAVLLSLAVQPVAAQDQRQGEPGKFDFYVLSLSWSPSYCDTSRERYADRTPDQQCTTRPYSFVVHGLWPQYEEGFPSYCQVPAPRLDRGVVASMLDLMPSPRLIFHEWDRHGTCSGLSARAYFETVRKARAVVKIPPEYLALNEALTIAPTEIKEAFLKVNPSLPQDAIAVACDNKRLTEVRICVSKEFGFHECAQTVARACKRDKIVMPPLRQKSSTADARQAEVQQEPK
ncbi:MAG TPA: ribonuclease T2 [Pseudolabrys sp.]|nr:ribonuclease T2 [Pseudolabrys sp.]